MELAAAEMIRAAGDNVSLELIGCGGVTEMPACVYRNLIRVDEVVESLKLAK
jgi:hypothetical protein